MKRSLPLPTEGRMTFQPSENNSEETQLCQTLNIKHIILDNISILFVVQHEILSPIVSVYGLHISMLPSLTAITTSYFNATFPHCHHHFILQCYLPSLPAQLHTSMLHSIAASTFPYFNVTFHRCQHPSKHFMLQRVLPSLPISVEAPAFRPPHYHSCHRYSTYFLGISILIF